MVSASEALDRGDVQGAFRILTAGIRVDPKEPQLRLALGTVFQKLGRLADAEEEFREALRVAPDHSRALFALAKLKTLAGAPAEAETLLRRAIEADPESLEMRVFLGRVLSDQNRFDDSIAEMRKTAEKFPGEAGPLTALGSRLNEVGQFKEARECFRKSVQIQPVQGFAYWGSVQGRRISEDEREIVQNMEAVLAQGSLKEGDRMHLLFALGKACDDLQDYSRAMDYFKQANRISDRAIVRSRGFPRERYLQLFELMRSLFSKEEIRFKTTDHRSTPAPIFIVGMPRSGTTLVEQILSSHSEVAPGGEINYWMEESAACLNLERQSFDFDRAFRGRTKYEKILQAVSPDATFVTDKTPGNYRALGIFRILWPDVKIISCKRHPVDTCLSIFMTPFRFPPDYSSDLEKLVFAYQQYTGLMGHWESTLGRSVMHIEYEDLVRDQEAVTRRLIQFCGLEWDASCLHPENNSRPVSTASLWQARQPIYRSSIERWRKYQPWLGPLAKLLDNYV